MYEEIDFNEDDWEYMEEEDTLEDYIKVFRSKFYKFLVDNNCLDNWIRNCYDRHGEDTVKCVKSTRDNLFISGLFSWDNTPEFKSDNEYWHRLSAKWDDLIY